MKLIAGFQHIAVVSSVTKCNVLCVTFKVGTITQYIVHNVLYFGAKCEIVKLWMEGLLRMCVGSWFHVLGTE